MDYYFDISSQNKNKIDWIMKGNWILMRHENKIKNGPFSTTSKTYTKYLRRFSHFDSFNWNRFAFKIAPHKM